MTERSGTACSAVPDGIMGRVEAIGLSEGKLSWVFGQDGSDSVLLASGFEVETTVANGI